MPSLNDARELVRIGEGLFSKRSPLNDLWQCIAENFYNARADFTMDRHEGEDYASHLFTSFPEFARRELGNLFAAKLRPRQLTWFAAHAADEELDENRDAREYLEYISKVQWRAMYDPESCFVTATRRADHDFATFGNTVIEVSVNRNRNGLLHRCRHLRDCAWMENADGKVDAVFFKWSPTARQLVDEFGKDAVSRETGRKFIEEPDATVACFVASVPERLYRRETNGRRERPWTYLAMEREKETILREVSEDWFRYVVPRWATVDGSPYARPTTTDIILPDGRTIQVVTRTLREAGEQFVNPPLIGVLDAFNGDAEFYPGGLTPIDMDFANDPNNRGLDDALKAVDFGNRGTMPVGFEIAQALKDDIRTGFFLDKIKLPDITSKEMTAYEFQKRIEEHVQASSPIFEPIEDEYNAPLVRLDYEILAANGAFGPASDIPDILSGANIEFKFRSPMREVQEVAKAGMFEEMVARIMGPAAEIDPALMATVDWVEATRDSVQGLGVPARWLNQPEVVAQAKAALAKQQEMQAGIQALQAGGEAATAVGTGAQSVEAAMGETA